MPGETMEIARHHFLHLHQDGRLPQIFGIYSNQGSCSGGISIAEHASRCKNNSFGDVDQCTGVKTKSKGSETNHSS